MEALLLIDFGSTYTKVTAVDPQQQRLLGTASSHTTVGTDINEGLHHALIKLHAATGELHYTHRFACSSAAGGLRMVASGLVPELTAEAARIACLGAGAKVVRLFSYELTPEDIAEIEQLKPDIFLLTGGIDGGNSRTILHNAAMLAGCAAQFPILIAGNRSAAAECKQLLAGRDIHLCPNVMPRINQLNIEPVQHTIRELFLQRIILAKGLSQAAELLNGILMPTPAAMLDAMKLLCSGTATERGLGELLAVDLGGATTDVYSMAQGSPENDATIIKGLPEPFEKRTVEGDIGMRHSAGGILACIGEERLAQLSQLPANEIPAMVQHLQAAAATLPASPQQHALDFALAAAAVEIACTRHAGLLEQTYTPMGPAYVQTGKNLTRLRTVIATGGALVHTRRTAEITAHAFYNPARPYTLLPYKADIWIDRKQILAAMGLLAAHNPACALHIMKKELEFHGTTE